MNRQGHPIDELFRRGLAQHVEATPHHLWEGIETQRETARLRRLVPWYRRYAVATALAAALLAGIWLSLPVDPVLESLPVPQMAIAGSAIETHKQVLEPVTGTEPAVSSLNNSTLTQAAARLTSSTLPSPATEKTEINTSEILTVEETVTEADIAITLRNPIKATPALSAQTHTLDYRPYTITNALMPIPETGCARFSNGRPAMFLSLTAGPALAAREITARDAEHEDYAQQRAATESGSFSYGADARLSLVFPWGGAIRTGLSFTQLNENFVYRNSKVRQTTITDIYGPNGEVIGSDTSYITENTTLSYHNYHRLIDIPLQAGYEMRYDKITLALNAGVNINLAYRQKGSYLGPSDLLPTQFGNDSDAEEPVYRDRVGLGWHASLGLHYQLNDHLDITAEPYLRYYSRSFTRANYPLNQNYLIGGVGVGLRILL